MTAPASPGGDAAGDTDCHRKGGAIIRPATLRKAAVNALLAALGTLAALAIVEGLLRLATPGVTGTVPKLEHGEVVYRPGQVFRFRAVEWDYEIRVNAQGFREDREVADLDRDFLLFLGDSFTEGYGVELRESYPKVLETLARAAGLPLLTFNAGHYATNPFNAMRVYREFFAGNPRLARVVLGFFAGNDLLSPSDPGDGRLPPGPTYSGSPVVRLKTWLGEHSELYARTNRALKSHPLLLRLCRRAGFCEAFHPVDIYHEAKTAASLPYTLGVLERFAGEVRRDGHVLTVVLIPTREQVEDERWDRVRGGFRDLAPGARFRVNRALAAGLERAGVDTIDLAPVFVARARSGEGSLYFRHDPHWNARGHALAAEEILRSLPPLPPAGDPGSASRLR